MYPYEGMFLVDPVAHGADPESVEGLVKSLLGKHGAKVADFERWDERKLAYEIKGHKRGVYLLTHFEMPGDNVADFRADCRLEEAILRNMLVRLEDDIPTYLEKSAAYAEKMREDNESRHEREATREGGRFESRRAPRKEGETAPAEGSGPRPAVAE